MDDKPNFFAYPFECIIKPGAIVPNSLKAAVQLYASRKQREARIKTIIMILEDRKKSFELQFNELQEFDEEHLVTWKIDYNTVEPPNETPPQSTESQWIHPSLCTVRVARQKLSQNVMRLMMDISEEYKDLLALQQDLRTLYMDISNKIAEMELENADD